MVESTCPISLVPFRAGDEICRIRHCNHSFKKHYILEWFRYNVRCPVCRYDIREYLNHLDLSNNNIEQNYSMMRALALRVVPFHLHQHRPHRIVRQAHEGTIIHIALRILIIQTIIEILMCFNVLELL